MLLKCKESSGGSSGSRTTQ